MVEVADTSVRLRLDVEDTLAGAERLGGMMNYCYLLISRSYRYMVSSATTSAAGG